MVRDKLKLSIVVASHNTRASIETCLTSLCAQQPEDGVEIIVVDNSTDGTTAIIQRCFPTVRLVVWPPSALIPQLWEAGIRQSAGDIVAITTAHCVPGQNWLSAILKAHEAAVPAIGGAIENDDSAAVIDWAIYFCRYSSYMLPFGAGFVSEIPGDNASYKRADIDRCQQVRRNGFWEPEVHAELKKAGLELLLTPSIVVYHKKSFNFWDFMKQRFQHGLQFGRARASRFSRPRRALYVLLSPAIPLIFLVRIVRQVLTKQRYRKELALSLPLLLVFLFAWTCGELIGYLRGPTG